MQLIFGVPNPLEFGSSKGAGLEKTSSKTHHIQAHPLVLETRAEFVILSQYVQKLE
jgi:hypothetical protein